MTSLSTCTGSGVANIVEVTPSVLLTITANEDVRTGGTVTGDLDYLDLDALKPWVIKFEPIGAEVDFTPDTFIGILSDKEAMDMKSDIADFRKDFGDDLARRSTLLFRK